jgi:hypothetical protein
MHRKPMKAKYISGSGGEGTAAIIEVNGEQYECMNCLGYGRRRGYRPGDVFYVSLMADRVKSDRTGRVTFGPNEDHVKRVKSLGGWRYLAFGVLVVSASNVMLDCGAVHVDLPYEVDPAMNGEYVAVQIDRMDCWRARGPAPRGR